MVNMLNKAKPTSFPSEVAEKTLERDSQYCCSTRLRACPSNRQLSSSGAQWLSWITCRNWHCRSQLTMTLLKSWMPFIAFHFARLVRDFWTLHGSCLSMHLQFCVVCRCASCFAPGKVLPLAGCHAALWSTPQDLSKTDTATWVSRSDNSQPSTSRYEISKTCTTDSSSNVWF